MGMQQTVLVVDDDERNIRLILLMLSKDDYHILSATGGAEAIEMVAENEPDIILLDIMMPGIDGFEVCKRLKADNQNKHIPVIMVTALQDREHKMRAMEAGADDFISKPIDQTELLIRVKSLLRLKRYHDQLKTSFDELSQKNCMLEELEEQKEFLTRMIVHDMRNPLNAINMSTELMLKLERSDCDKFQRLLGTCKSSCIDLEQMIQNILDIRMMEEQKLELSRKSIDFSCILNNVISQFKLKIDDADISLSVNETGSNPIQADFDLMKRIVANLLNNAIRHTPEGGEISIEASSDPGKGKFRFALKDSGEGVPEELRETIFHAHMKVDSAGNGTRKGRYGLGLAFCRMAVEAHGGRIWVECDGEGRGSTFLFELPV